MRRLLVLALLVAGTARADCYMSPTGTYCDHKGSEGPIYYSQTPLSERRGGGGGYACSDEPVSGYPLCPNSPLAKKRAAECAAADKALDEVMRQAEDTSLHGGMKWEDFRVALTARLKLNCSP